MIVPLGLVGFGVLGDVCTMAYVRARRYPEVTGCTPVHMVLYHARMEDVEAEFFDVSYIVCGRSVPEKIRA